jgi:hypothetical protein
MAHVGMTFCANCANIYVNVRLELAQIHILAQLAQNVIQEVQLLRENGYSTAIRTHASTGGFEPMPCCSHFLGGVELLG